MGIMTWGMFWGIVLVLIGLSIILKAVFKIDLPVFRIVMAGFFIWIGISMLMGRGCCRMKSEREAIFCESSMNATGGDYSVVFGRGTVDATKVKGAVKVATVFGSSTVYVSKTIPTQVRANVGFGGLRLPDGNTVPLGSYTWNNEAAKSAPIDSVQVIRVDCAFGACEIIEK